MPPLIFYYYSLPSVVFNSESLSEHFHPGGLDIEIRAGNEAFAFVSAHPIDHAGSVDAQEITIEFVQRHPVFAREHPYVFEMTLSNELHVSLELVARRWFWR